MSNTNYLYDVQWALRLLDDLEKFIQNSQLFMAKSTIQRVKETLETYGRPGFESNFDKIHRIEIALDKGQDPRDLIVALKSEINQRIKRV